MNNNQHQQILQSSSIKDFKSRLRAYHCTQCTLSSEIEQNPTTSRGNPHSKVMIVGEAPGHNEMLQGIPFVGRAGQLMDKMLESIGLSTEKDAYVTNICRCRPLNNRTPKVNEAKTCITYLKKEIEIIKPRFVLTLGATSSKYILGKSLQGKSMGNLVGRYYKLDEYPAIEFLVLYHPAALLYNPNLKEPMLELLKLFKARLDSLKLIGGIEPIG